MTATTSERDTTFAGHYVARITLDMAASTVGLKGTIATKNASDQATPGVAANGYDALGVFAATCDNGAGAAGDVLAEIDSGIHELGYTGTAPKVDQAVYVYDNQTVTTDSGGGTYGIAGIVTELRNSSQCFVKMGPDVVRSVKAGVGTGIRSREIPLGNFRVAASGAAVGAFDDGSADGFSNDSNEAFGIKFNPGTTAKLATNVALPPDLDSSKDIVLKVFGNRVGADDVTAAVTFEVFFQTVGAANTADADAGGDTTAFDGATTVSTQESLTIAAADVPAPPAIMTLTMVPNAALDADDLLVQSVTPEYTPI